MFSKVPTETGIITWHQLAMKHFNNVTIADNPHLFTFYSEFLNLPAYYFFFKSGIKIDGLFAIVKAGRVYISMPHFSYGGILWLEPRKSSINPVLIEKTVSSLITDEIEPGFYELDYRAIAERGGLKDPRIEVRSSDPLYSNNNPDKVVNRINLELFDCIDLNSFKSDIRRKVRKAEKSGISVQHGGEELLIEFTAVYNRNMHRKGSPTLGLNFFKALHLTPGVESEIFIAYKNKKAVGGSFSMWYNGYYENTWFSTLSEYNNLYVSYLLHYEMIKSAYNKKANFYSMGRSNIGSGTHKYKSQWPTEELHLFFSTNCPGPAKLKNLMWAPMIWKRLPKGIVDSIGPLMAKRIY